MNKNLSFEVRKVVGLTKSGPCLRFATKPKQQKVKIENKQNTGYGYIHL